MKLYVCYGTWKYGPLPKKHPCGLAYHALKDAGHDPEVVRSYGSGLLGAPANFMAGRREVKRLTGNYWVPALVTDGDEIVQGSREIEKWAKDHPASRVAAGSASG